MRDEEAANPYEAGVDSRLQVSRKGKGGRQKQFCESISPPNDIVDLKKNVYYKLNVHYLFNYKVMFSTLLVFDNSLG